MNYVPYTDYTRPVDLQQQIASLQSQINSLGMNNIAPPFNVPVTPMPQLTPAKRYRQIDSVDGIKGAKEYQDSLAPGSSAIIADRNENVLYMVSVDANGNSPEEITVLDFQIRKQKAEQPQYVTRQDFDAFASEIKALLGKEKVNEQST